MKFFVILLVSALVTLALVGCVQARVGSPEYTDPYGFRTSAGGEKKDLQEKLTSTSSFTGGKA
jgi:hypothetical protein